MASYYPPEMLTLDDSMAVDSDPEVDELASDAGGVDDAVSVQEDTGPSIRTAGSSLLPMLRIENIIQADGVAGNLTMSKEALFVVSVATEEFIKRLAQGGLEQAKSDDRYDVHYDDMAATTLQYQEFRFLEDFIPTPIPLDLALQERENIEARVLDEEPTPIAFARPQLHPAGPTTSSTSKFRVNGTKAKSNGRSNGHKSRSASAAVQALPVPSIESSVSPSRASTSLSTTPYVYPDTSENDRLEDLKKALERARTPELLELLRQGNLQVSLMTASEVNSHPPSSTDTTAPTTDVQATPAETPEESRDPSATSSVRDLSEAASAMEDVKPILDETAGAYGSKESAIHPGSPSRGSSISVDSLLIQKEEPPS